MTDETVHSFAALFDGRRDAYGTDQGGCDRTDNHTDHEYHRRITAHLVGSNPMGVYPLRDDNTVMWGCIDLDGGDDDYPAAVALRDALQLVGLNGWIESSRSKGWHVWTFAAEPVPATVMREALLGLHQALGIPADEVNPKQTTLAPGQLGNYVRLPYPGAAMQAPARQVVQGEADRTLDYKRFVAEALASRSTAAAYKAVADTYYLPPPPAATVTLDPDEVAVDDHVLAKLNRAGYLAWKYGPSEGHDRSSSLVRLGYLCEESGLTATEAFAVVADLDRRLGKFHGRDDAEDQLMKIIERAFSRRTTTDRIHSIP